MKVYARGKLYSGEIEPVAVVLTDKDRESIAKMGNDCTVYLMVDRDRDKLTIDQAEQLADAIKARLPVEQVACEEGSLAADIVQRMVDASSPDPATYLKVLGTMVVTSAECAADLAGESSIDWLQAIFSRLRHQRDRERSNAEKLRKHLSTLLAMFREGSMTMSPQGREYIAKLSDLITSTAISESEYYDASGGQKDRLVAEAMLLEMEDYGEVVVREEFWKAQAAYREKMNELRRKSAHGRP